MIRSAIKSPLLLAAVVTALSGCAGHQSPKFQRDFSALVAGREAVQDKNVPRYGAARFAYRFTLINPETGNPWPNRPFRLFAKRHDLPSRQPSANIFHGVTDAQGKTPIFRMERRIPDTGWVLMERIGDGAFGKSFLLTSSGRRSKPLRAYRYAVVVCATPKTVYKGYTSASGDTAYVTSDKPARIVLLTEGEGYGDTEITKACDPDQ